MSLERLGRAILKRTIVKFLDSTHCAMLTEIITNLLEEIKRIITAEEKEKAIMDIVREMIRSENMR